MFTTSYLLIACLCLAHSSGESENRQNQKETTISPEEKFKQLFSLRRTEQLTAVRNILKYDGPKQETLVNTVIHKIFDVIKSSRARLESAGYIPGLSAFPEDEKTRDALSNILENTSLFGDILLHLPDLSTSVLQKNNEYNVLLTWSYHFVNQVNLLDKKTIKLMSLMSQELNITERHPDYVNPYKKSHQRQQTKNQNEPKTEPKKKKKKIPKGPRLSDEL